LEPNSLKSVEREEASTAPPSVCASVGAAVAATGVGAGAASVLGVLGALAALEAGAGVGTGAPRMSAGGRGVGAEAEEEVFFAILSWYTLIGEVFLSIFRPYILYLAFLLKKDSYYRHKISIESSKINAFILL
jgi:hypothetical protein